MPALGGHPAILVIPAKAGIWKDKMRILSLLLLFITVLFSASTLFAAEDGCKDVPLNDIEYARKLAEQGDANAQYVLGALYSRKITKEKGGLYKDYLDEETEKWFRKAAEQGHVKAQGYLCARYKSLTRYKSNYRHEYKNKVIDEDFLKNEIQWCFKSAGRELNSHEFPEDKKTQKGSGQIPKSVIEEIPLNVVGLICGGQARDCEISDSCNDLVGIVCKRQQPKYIIASKAAKNIVSSCPSKTEGCVNLVPKEWTCDSPKNMPLSAADQKKYSQQKNRGDRVISCGDVLGVGGGCEDCGYDFISKVTGEKLGSCSFWQSFEEQKPCAPPKEWTCSDPSNY